MRPQCLAAAGDSFDRCLAIFLDAFYVAPEAAELSEPPPLLAPSDPVTGPVWDAYLAATAKSLARCLHLASPFRWTVITPLHVAGEGVRVG